MTDEEYEELCEFLKGVWPQTALVMVLDDYDGDPQWAGGPLVKPTIYVSREDSDDLWSRVGSKEIRQLDAGG